MKNTIVEYIKQSATKYANKIAYDDMDNQISFKEIDVLSSRIASKVIEYNLYNEPILVLADRNAYTPIAYMGIAKAGCFYVPIDSSLNINRINKIINSANFKLLFINNSLRSMLEKIDYKGEIIFIEEALETRILEYELNEINNKIDCQMPLYVIYTSGSTGIPKGVITSHNSLINYIEAVDEVLNLCEEDILGNQSPLDYIAAIRDIFLPLKTGATTVIIPKNEFAMASDLAKTLDNKKVSILCWSAAGLEVSAKSGLLDEVTTNCIRKVLFSGSILPGKILSQWQKRFPNAQFINQYGPTETTASCTYYVVETIADNNTILPIGVPYKNYKIILLNDDETETELGEIGEICVSGIGVTLGYYGNKELTEKSFIQNPINSKYREIIYKTGDLGRYNEKGILQFCGRKDRQIKHLGHRIELEEIELCAKAIDGITDCIAMYDAVKAILYLVYCGNVDKKEIIMHYRENIPSFMVPRKVINVEAIPYLPNGKIDVNKVKKLIMKE